MKQTIIIIAFLIVLISIPILSEANDSLVIKSETPLLQNQEVKLPWYKTLKYEFGYSGGICLNSSPLGTYHDILNNNFTWFNTLDISIILPDKRGGIGFEYGWWPYLTNRRGLYLYLYETHDSSARVTTDNWAIYYNGILLKYYKTKSFYYGISIDHFIANTEENYHSAVNGVLSNITTSVQRKCIGGAIYCGLKKHVLLNKFELIPFIKLQVGHAVEYHNNSPWDWGSKKLTIGTSGIFLGINIRYGGKK